MINIKDLEEKFILPVYKDAYNSDKPYIVINGGGHSGKTYFVTAMLVLNTFSDKSNKSLIITRDAETFYFVMDNIEMVLRDMGIEDLFELDRQKRLLKNKETGNSVRVSCVEDGSIYVHVATVDKIWFDDASIFEESEVKKIDRNTKRNCQMIFTFNPIPCNAVKWIKSAFLDSDYDDNYVLSTTYKDNPHTPREMAELLEGFKGTSDYYYKVYCLGEFAE